MKFGAIFLSALATSIFNVEAAPTPKNATAAQYVFQVKSSSSFCSFLPSKPGQNVALNEKTGVPFCTEDGLGGQLFPDGFIKNVNFTTTDTFIQVRADIDASAYQLKSNDGGGQYDYHDVSGQCSGYPYFVNLVEPDIQDLCIRCCQKKEDCNINVSGYGCNRVVPEVDSSGNPVSSVGSAPSSTAGASAPASSASSSGAASSPAPTDNGSSDDSSDSSDGSSDDTGDASDGSDSTDDSDSTDGSNSTDGSDSTDASDASDSTDSSAPADASDSTDASAPADSSAPSDASAPVDAGASTDVTGDTSAAPTSSAAAV